MSKQTEALKLAQKAMGLIGADLVCEAAHHEKKDRHQIGEPCPIQARWHQAFAAIREALAEQPAQQQEPVAWLVESKHGNWAPYLEWSEPSYLETQVVTPLYTSPQPAQQETVSDRENAIIRFALHQFMSNAYSHMNAAAQDKDGRRYPLAAVEKFAKDAKDAEALLSRLRFKAPPAPAQPNKPWVGLDQHDIDVLFLNEDGVRFARYIEAKLKEKNT